MKLHCCFLVGLFTGILFSCSSEPEEERNWKSETSFPEKEQLDYRPRGYIAKVAFPDKETGTARVWVKGSRGYPKCRLEGKTHELGPPYYTKVVAVRSDSLAVEFGDNTGRWSKPLVLYPKVSKHLRKQESFSIMAYGCFQPFHVNERGEPVVRSDSMQSEAEIREVMRKVALNMPLTYKVAADSSRCSGNLLQKPRAVLGTGDQTYVDAAYYTAVEKNPMTAWTKGDVPRPLLQPKAFEQHLDRMYLSFASFRIFDEVFRRLPSAAVWDDHEIRDGWGSQGDEYLDEGNGPEALDPELKPYFLSAYEAYADHQFALGPRTVEEVDSASGLYQEIQLGGMDVFLMDLRSHRNIKQQQAMSHRQLREFERWLKSLDSGQAAMIVSSVPLFWEAPNFLEGFVKTMKKEMEDDVMDAWSSEANVEQRNRIYQMLLQARISKDIKPIILSGDIHVGAINQVWYTPSGNEGEQRVLAYEMVVSGLAHRALHEQNWSRQLTNLMSSKGLLAQDVPLQSTGEGYDVSVNMKLSAAKLNFGAVEIADSALTLNLFFKDDYQMLQFRLAPQWESNDRSSGFRLEEVKTRAGGSLYLTGGEDLEKRIILGEELDL